MPEGSYAVAIVQRVCNRWRDGNYDEILILASKPIQLEEEILGETNTRNTLYAMFLINMIMNMHIWKALNSELETANLNILKGVLQTDSIAGENCPQCYYVEKHYIDVSSVGATIRSQEEAVITCLAAKDCRHQNSVKLIWGPPRMGKTNTVAALLFALLKRKCRMLICAPTNIAVLEVTTRLLRLVTKTLKYGTYGIGDIVLFGNRERMKIDERDDLLDTFLDCRVDVLSKCFAPLSGWKHYLKSMILLLEDPEEQYCDYAKKEGRKMGNGLQSNQAKESAHARDSNNCSYGVWKKIIDHNLEESRRNWKENLHRQKNNQRVWLIKKLIWRTLKLKN